MTIESLAGSARTRLDSRALRPMQPRRHREVLARVALVCFGIVVAVLALEAALQAGSLVIRATGRSPREVAHAGRRTLLCLGDSNVYGLHVEHQEAWPSVLEGLWNADDRRAPVDVVNLGFPGTNSSTLRNALPKLLSIFHPTLVLVMVGVNDFWTVPQPVEDADLSTRVDALLWRASRVYRLVYMIRRAFEAPEIDLTWRGEDRPNTAVVRYGRERVQWSHTAKEGGYPQWRAALRTNLAEIAAQIRRTGAQPVFVTYPADLPFSS